MAKKEEESEDEDVEEQEEQEEAEEDEEDLEQLAQTQQFFEPITGFDPQALVLQSGETQEAPPQPIEDLDTLADEPSTSEGDQPLKDSQPYTSSASYEEADDDYVSSTDIRGARLATTILEGSDERQTVGMITTPNLRAATPMERAAPQREFEHFQKTQEEYEVRRRDEGGAPFQQKRESKKITKLFK